MTFPIKLQVHFLLFYCVRYNFEYFPPKLTYDKYLKVKTSMVLKLRILFYFGP